MEYKDYYAILGVDRKASQDDIKQAYRRLARKYHPDVSKEANAEEHFKNVQEAYEVLKDSEKRKAYNELGANWKAGQEFRPPPGWQSYSREFGQEETGGFSEGDLHGFSDFFSNLFGGGQFDRADFGGMKHRGSDQHAKILITLEEAFRGTSRTFQLQMPEIDASGNLHPHTRTLKVNIPPGATQGQQLRLAKQGGLGMGGAQAGDLYLEIDIQPHPLFTLQGQDVYLTLPVTPWEAALGGDIRVPTLGGPVGLKLAPDSQAGQKLRLKGRGMPSKPHVGDQYAILQIMTPPAHSDDQRQLYKKLAEAMPFNPRQNWVV